MTYFTVATTGRYPSAKTLRLLFDFKINSFKPIHPLIEKTALFTRIDSTMFHLRTCYDTNDGKQYLLTVIHKSGGE